ncbi:universal stress protein [Streptomyces sp. XY332]|uniref:universal stress protein n=1 Tax=Streptomyces sp. XY332 TaxID=1415561 RepID=UPI001F1AF915|nr:universal stress protein [Streptomyces sp. XY332]
MSNRIAVGLDGSGAGSAAADWAANEAELRGAGLELVHTEDWAQYGPFAAPLPEPRRQWAEDLLSLTRDRLLREHGTLDITTHGSRSTPASPPTHASPSASPPSRSWTRGRAQHLSSSAGVSAARNSAPASAPSPMR